ncbi:hypothetical protein QVD17_06077 [Tagetes erecta]|uniref:Uncharacterized protein n=1 Tax=Tagetes erecta TaxID=13708 RepID=A0AAD8PBZ1_TARER|nr:hypothetical protein QVD17_06077 [Tagetes erecta]
MSCNLFFISLLLLLVILSASAHNNGGHRDNNDTTTTQKPNLRSKSLISVKIWCLILVFLGTSIGGVSPYFLNWNEEFLVLGTQFAGGVFLATAMMHFLSDASETLEELTTIEYPFAFMLACGGYLLTMLADCVISYFYGKHSNFDVENQAYVFAFGISSPIGVGIGIIIDDTTVGCVVDWIFAISMGIACGVFMYVSINHLLQGYHVKKSASVDTPHHKLLAVTLGMGVIALVMIWDT